MNRLERDAVLLELLKQLQSEGSWCGETHLQKAAYFLQRALKVPMQFDFILYKHGPFSFELRDELTAMRADDFLTLQSPSPPYGPSFTPGPSAGEIQRRFERVVQSHQSRISFVAKALGKKQVVDLERLGTALYVLLDEPGTKGDEKAIAARIHELKPHISRESGREAFREVNDLIRQAPSRE